MINKNIHFALNGKRVTKHECTGIRDRRFLIVTTAIAVLMFAADGMQTAAAQSVTGTGVLPAPNGSTNWVINGDLHIGLFGAGSLTIDSGGVVNINNPGQGFIGREGGTGIVTVSGSDGHGQVSTWNMGFQNLAVGIDGTGTLIIKDGGKVGSGQSSIGYISSGSQPSTPIGVITVSGSDGDGHISTWTNSSVFLGRGGSGTLRIEDGGMVITDGIGHIGYDNSGTGMVIVSGHGSTNASTWILHNPLYIGEAATGRLDIVDGGVVAVDRDVTINKTGGNGTLNLLGDSTNGRGVLETGSVIAGDNAAILNFNGGILRANRDEADFLNGFTTLDVSTAGGAWFDTNGHSVGISTDFSGTSGLNKLGAGTLTLTGNSIALTGDSTVQGGTLQVDGRLGGTMNVLSGARLTGTGQVGVTTNRGVIAPGHVGSLGEFTIAGNYTPAGGTVEIRTRLGDDNSPTDRLIITGATSGITPVKVINFGGAGAQTTEGIKIIDVAGISNGTFTLLGTITYQGDPAIVAGPYAYRLYKGGASTPTDGDWYLRSVVQDTSTPPTTPSTTPPTTTPPTTPATLTPLYQPGVPTYEIYSQVLLGLNGVPSLQQRVGNRFWNDGSALSSPNDGNGVTGQFTGTNGMWIRVEAGHNRIDPKYSTSGSDYEYGTTKMQVGLDTMLLQSDSGKLVGGLSVHYVHGSAETNWRYGADNYGSGDISTDGYGPGGTLTWYGNNGFYVDGTAQATWYSSDLSANPIHGLEKSNDAIGYALSIESGKRIAMNQGWFFTPQAQLIYSKTRFDNFNDVFGASVHPGCADSLQARLGVSLERQVNRKHLYGIVNIFNEFLDGTSITVDSQTFRNRNDRLWAGIGFGGSYNWNNDKYSIYGEGTYSTSLADSDSRGFGATAGFRVNW